MSKSSLDLGIYLQHKKIEYERNCICLLFFFFFFFTKINNLRNKSTFIFLTVQTTKQYDIGHFSTYFIAFTESKFSRHTMPVKRILYRIKASIHLTLLRSFTSFTLRISKQCLRKPRI